MTATRTAGSDRRRWPLLVIGASAGTATWSGWVGLGALTGFGLVHPLPGIWDGLTLNTAITLPIGVEAYAVYALSVATDQRALTAQARRYAWLSAGSALVLGMAGQIAYHLVDHTGTTRAPWWITAVVSCLPVLVLGAASLLWHLARQNPAPSDGQTESGDGGSEPDPSPSGPAVAAAAGKGPAITSAGLARLLDPVPPIPALVRVQQMAPGLVRRPAGGSGLIAACGGGPSRLEAVAVVVPNLATRPASARVLADLDRVREAVADGRIDGRVTKAKIRAHLRCANPHAGQINALYQQITETSAPAHTPDEAPEEITNEANEQNENNR